MQRKVACRDSRLAWTLVACLLLLGGSRSWLSWNWSSRPNVDAPKAPPTRSESTSKWFRNPWTTQKPDVGTWTPKVRGAGQPATQTHFVGPGIVATKTLRLDNYPLLLVGGAIALCVACLFLHLFSSTAAGGHWHEHALCSHCGCGLHNVLYFISEPGKPDALFGSLCLISNLFFLALVPFFWIRRKVLEVVWVAMVTMASTIYHGYQLHPFHGPLGHLTRCACAGDVLLSVSFGLYLAFSYKGRKRAAPVAAAALLCFIIPSLLPTGRIAEVAYSLLHSTWHGLAAAAAYLTCAGPARVSSVRKGTAKVGAFLMSTASHTRLPIIR